MRPAPALVACCVLLLASGGLLRAVASDLETPRDLHRSAYTGSAACARCHPSHDASWRRTFHRTMTREARADEVLGDFSGRARVTYFGVRATPYTARDGALRVRFEAHGAQVGDVAVARTVGSRRFQQLLAREGASYTRLPIAWDVEERRWLHLNGAFLTPDPEVAPGGEVTREDYERHLSRWDDNCIFCHNVAPNPRRHPLTGAFSPEVAELGIACEACHGPGAEHARANTSPVRRYALHLGTQRDPTIVNPARLSPARSADVCGRCHGQRLARDVAPFLDHGDPFVPGDTLSTLTRPLARDTPLGGDATAFAARFWKDGTPRLTAYEYQGLLQSRCASEGELTCTTCHGMHEGDPRGQLRDDARGDGACVSCHAPRRDEPAAHTTHAAIACVSCHMPKLVYGLIGAHRSHRIEVPDPARDASNERPDACTNCHVDRARAWAIRAVARWRGESAPHGPDDVPELDRAVRAGDPIERVLAATALGEPRAPSHPSRRGARVGLLLEVMRDDPYPAVRRAAWRAVRPWLDVPSGVDFDPTGTPAARALTVASLRAPWVAWPDAQQSAVLRAHAQSRAIEIGE